MNTTHPLTESGVSQSTLILAALKGRFGEWVNMVDLWRASGSMNIHSRISDLRKRGLFIEQRSERVGRKVHSLYRLTCIMKAAK